ncbi:MAG TPA: iron-sulfur cluster assembly scaffold protein [Anaerolineae bacterium]|nr:iron-sulfur cluster assembly scaffold protein [Anaerolineae bacterium]
MMDGLYNTDVLGLAANIQHVGRLETPQASSRKVSKLCGSWVEIDVVVIQKKIIGFAIRLQACALGQASAAILAEHAMGAHYSEIKQARDDLHKMLKQGGKPPSGRFKKLAVLADVANYPARHTSTMLAFDACVEAMERASA